MKTIPLETIADRVQELAAEGHPPAQVADLIIPSLNTAALKILARQWLVELAGEYQRAQEYRVRRESAEPSSPRRRRDHGNRRSYDRGCRCAECVAWVTASEEADRTFRGQLFGSLTSILDDYTAALKVEWTAELLESTFGTPSGRVSWGEATIADHEAHINMDYAHIDGYLRDAAMHTKAIEEIQRRGASCLNDALTAA